MKNSFLLGLLVLVLILLGHGYANAQLDETEQVVQEETTTETDTATADETVSTASTITDFGFTADSSSTISESVQEVFALDIITEQSFLQLEKLNMEKEQRTFGELQYLKQLILQLQNVCAR